MTARGERWRDRALVRLLDRWWTLVEPRRLARARRRAVTSASLGPPLVSVPIATYDRIDLLVERTVPALLAQTHPAMEVVIVGDGTDPALFARLERIDDPRVRVHRLARRTRYPRWPVERWMVAGWRPRNVAAAMARGEWLLWMSDDDILLPDAVEALLAAAGPDGEAVTGAYRVGTVAPTVRYPGDGASGIGFPASGMPAFLVRSYLRCFRWNRHSWRRRWNRPSDYDLMVRMHRSGVRFTTTDEVVAVVPEVAGTGLIGSAGSIEEDRRRADRAIRPPSDGS